MYIAGIVSYRVCWGVCACLECVEVKHEVLFCFLCVLAMGVAGSRGRCPLDFKIFYFPGAFSEEKCFLLVSSL